MRKFLSLLLLIPAAASADVTGTAHVVDGDTVHINSAKIRLHGVDAPEQRQTCMRDQSVWNCGLESTETLKELINQSVVTCTELGKGRYKRIIGVCYVQGRDLNAEMVKLGMAVAYSRYSNDYIKFEEEAKLNGVGMWSSRFVMPWDWRRGKRLSSMVTKAENSSACKIKGNINSKGERIYHLPDTRWYTQTIVSASKGEKWFCTEADATNSGWRPTH